MLNFKIIPSRVLLKQPYSTIKQPLAITHPHAMHCARHGAQPAARSPQKPSRATLSAKKRDCPPGRTIADRVELFP